MERNRLVKIRHFKTQHMVRKWKGGKTQEFGFHFSFRFLFWCLGFYILFNGSKWLVHQCTLFHFLERQELDVLWKHACSRTSFQKYQLMLKDFVTCSTQCRRARINNFNCLSWLASTGRLTVVPVNAFGAVKVQLFRIVLSKQQQRLWARAALNITE